MSRTRLITKPVDPQVLTNLRETDVQTALTRGLAEYLQDLVIVMQGGREFRFARVFDKYPDAEDSAEYPAAIVYSGQAGTYDASQFTPRTFDVASGITVRAISEFSIGLTVEVWANDTDERIAFAALMEDALNPVDWMYGLRLELPHYYGTRATYELTGITYLDSPEDLQRRWVKAAFAIQANVTQYKSLHKSSPRLSPRIGTSIDTDVVIVKPVLPSPAEPPVVVYDEGPSGPQGAVGPEGPIGPPGPNGAGFNFTQAVPSLTWTINHNLGYYPSVELFSVGGLEIDADVQHVSVNQTVVTFLIATAGSARLN